MGCNIFVTSLLVLDPSCGCPYYEQACSFTDLLTL